MKHVYRILMILLLCIIAGGVLFLYRIKPEYNNKGMNGLNDKKEESVLDEGTEVFNNDGILRILVLGVDKTATKQLSEEKNGMRSDTIMLFSIDPKNNKVQLLSIPRDSYIRIHGYDKNKINAAFSDIVYPGGGLKLVASTVEDLLDVKIDHYGVVDYKAVTQIVDAVGGIDVEWDRPDYTYTDDWVVPPLQIEMKRGTNHLDGKKAVDYLRIRKAYDGSDGTDKVQDIGRIDAQQGFLMLLFDKLKSPSMLLKVPELLDIVDQYVETDLTYGQMVTLARFGVGLDREDISTATVEGKNRDKVKIGSDLVSVYDVNAQDAQALVLRNDVAEETAENNSEVNNDSSNENKTENNSNSNNKSNKDSTVNKEKSKKEAVKVIKSNKTSK